uniref:UBIQUITIN_CONJUGAT_2 domain-containing protein n=1 Tax=Rhabditophanes sp. KR3021 TaxID=114890 RepID=A0AC35TH36_9BILA
MLNLKERQKGNNQNKQYLETRFAVRERLLAGELPELEQSVNKMPSCTLTFPTNKAYEMDLIIKPVEGEYRGGRFHFYIEVPVEYNNAPPTVKCKTKCYHPNISEDGSVCLSVLRASSLDGHGWRPTRKIIDVIHGLDALFTDLMDFEDPLNVEAATLFKRNQDEFKRKVRDYIRNYCNQSGEHANVYGNQRYR